MKLESKALSNSVPYLETEVRIPDQANLTGMFVVRSNYIYMDFPGGSDGKVSVYNMGDLGSSPGLGRSPGEGNGNPLQYYCLEKSHGQRSLVSYSLWGRKESDTTEQTLKTL